MSQKIYPKTIVAILVFVSLCGVARGDGTSFRFAAPIPAEGLGQGLASTPESLDIGFALFGGADGDGPIGPRLLRTGVPVVNRVILVELDFGIALEEIDRPLIEIEARPAGADPASPAVWFQRLPATTIRRENSALLGPSVLNQLPFLDIDLVDDTQSDAGGGSDGTRRLVVDPSSFSGAFGIGAADAPISIEDLAAISLVAARETARRSAEQEHRIRLLEATVDAIRFRMTLVLALTLALGLVLVFTRPGGHSKEPKTQTGSKDSVPVSKAEK